MWLAPAAASIAASRARTGPSSRPAPRCWLARGRAGSRARSGTATARCAAGSAGGSPAGPADRAASAAPCAGCRARRAAGCRRRRARRRCRGSPRAATPSRSISSDLRGLPAAGARRWPRRRCRRRSPARRTPCSAAASGGSGVSSRASAALGGQRRQARPHANGSAGSKTRVASSVTCARPWISGSTAFAGTSGQRRRGARVAAA